MFHLQLTPDAIPLLLSALMAEVLAFYAWRRRQTPGTTTFTLLMGAVGVWSLGEALFMMSTEPSTALFWIKAEYLGMVSTPVLWFVFAARYSGQERWLTRRNLMLLFSVPLVVALLAWTNEFHGLYYTTVSVDTSGPFAVLNRTPGPGYWFSVAYSYLLFLSGTILFAYMFFRSPRPYRCQSSVLLLGAAIPWLANVLHNTGLSPWPDLDITPFAFALTGAVMAWGLFRFKLLDIVPVARDRIVENMSDGIIVLDAQMRIVDINPAAQKLIGRSLTEIIGQPLDQIAPSDLDVIEQFQDIEEVQTQVTLRRKDSQLHFDLRISPLRDRRENFTGRLIVARNITKLRQAEEALRQARDVAEKAQKTAEVANQAKSTFLANMSHELRTPLNIILGFSELMMHDSNLSSDQVDNLATINRSGDHLLALINDVLELAKIEAGRAELQEESFDPHFLLLELKEMFRLRAEQKGLALTFERRPGLPQSIHADAHKLRQVLINLLGNAIKFTDKGAVKLRVKYNKTSSLPSQLSSGGRRPGDGAWSGEYSGAGRSSLTFEIEDTGVGIAPDVLDTIFAPFVQITSGRQAHEGTGLGLAISRDFVHLMGGEITVRSGPGQGSAFRVEIPVEVVDHSQVPTAPQTHQVIGLEPGQPIYRLLIADGVEASPKLLFKLLAPLGFEVRTASNGQEAVRLWEAWQPHLIWMGLRMSIMDGIEATRRIKSTPRGRETVIVALTASAFEQDRATVLAEGFDDFVRKPFHKTEIFSILARRLGVQFLYADAESTADKRTLPPAATLAALPADWKTALRQAAIEADVEEMRSLIAHVRKQDAALADTLTTLMDGFDYDAICKMLD